MKRWQRLYCMGRGLTESGGAWMVVQHGWWWERGGGSSGGGISMCVVVFRVFSFRPLRFGVMFLNCKFYFSHHYTCSQHNTQNMLRVCGPASLSPSQLK